MVWRLTTCVVNRHPNIAFFGGTIVIAIMVLAAFSNMAIAGGCSMQQKNSAAQNEQIDDKKSDKKKVEA